MKGSWLSRDLFLLARCDLEYASQSLSALIKQATERQEEMYSIRQHLREGQRGLVIPQVHLGKEVLDYIGGQRYT